MTGRGKHEAQPGAAGPVFVSGRVKCSCGRFLVSLGAGTSFTSRQIMGRRAPPDGGLVLNCRCGNSWELVGQGRSAAWMGQPGAIKARVFLFDDRAPERQVLASLLRRRGYEVVAFPEATACTECPLEPGTTCADMAICRVANPGAAGIDFTKHQLAVGCKWRNWAIISGDCPPPDLQQVRDLGSPCFGDPPDLRQLAKWLDDCEAKIEPDRILSSFYQDANPHE